MPRLESQYCAYSHVSAMLDRSRTNWWLAMFELEVYFDDSGTDGTTPIAVGACYVSSKEQWDEFARNWDEVAKTEGFDVFHMCEFMAKPEAGHKPFCEWDNKKKDRVYAKLASIINTRIRYGFAVAVPKAPFDRYVFQEFKDGCAADHYTWAVRSILMLLSSWRQKYKLTTPMQYIFHRGSLSQGRLQQIWESDSKKNSALASLRFGMVPDGIMFQDEARFKPLQAADILAWQIQNQMRRTVMVGIPTHARPAHHGLRTLVENRSVSISYYGTDQLKKLFDDARIYKQKRGEWPWIDSPWRDAIVLGKAGTVY